MTVKPLKPPTIPAVYKILAAAGFQKSERIIGGYSTGYKASIRADRPGVVYVRHVRWSIGPSADAVAVWQGRYAVAITAAGYAVERSAVAPGQLIVTLPN